MIQSIHRDVASSCGPLSVLRDAPVLVVSLAEPAGLSNASAIIKSAKSRPGHTVIPPGDGDQEETEDLVADIQDAAWHIPRRESSVPRSREKARPTIGIRVRTGSIIASGAIPTTVRARDAVVFASRMNPSVNASTSLRACLGFCPTVSSVKKLKVSHPESYASFAISVPFADVEETASPPALGLRNSLQVDK